MKFKEDNKVSDFVLMTLHTFKEELDIKVGNKVNNYYDLHPDVDRTRQSEAAADLKENKESGKLFQFKL